MVRTAIADAAGATDWAWQAGRGLGQPLPAVLLQDLANVVDHATSVYGSSARIDLWRILLLTVRSIHPLWVRFGVPRADSCRPMTVGGCARMRVECLGDE